MILIQSQLCGIDQSDLFIARSQGGGNQSGTSFSFFFFHFFFPPHSASLFPACLSSTGCARVYTTYVGGPQNKKKRRPSNQSDPGARGNLSSQADMSKFFCSLACCVSPLVCLFFLFFCLSPVSPLPHRRLAPSTARHQDTPAVFKTCTRRQVTKTGPDFPAHQRRRRGLEPS